VVYRIDPTRFPETDPDFSENRKALAQGLARVSGRQLETFDDGSYAVKVEGHDYVTYFLDDGVLYRVDYTGPQQTSFPQRIYSYATIDVVARPNSYELGELARVAIKVDPMKSFVFMPDGSLIATWEGNACFYADGNACDADEAPYLKP
jgi:hypothetical protein